MSLVSRVMIACLVFAVLPILSISPVYSQIGLVCESSVPLGGTLVCTTIRSSDFWLSTDGTDYAKKCLDDTSCGMVITRAGSIPDCGRCVVVAACPPGQGSVGATCDFAQVKVTGGTTTVGGSVSATDKLGLLAPYIALGTVIAAIAAAIFLRRGKGQDQQ